MTLIAEDSVKGVAVIKVGGTYSMCATEELMQVIQGVCVSIHSQDPILLKKFESKSATHNSIWI